MSRKAKVLVVDDDPDFVEVARMALQAEGFEVLVADDSRDGVAKARNEEPDVVILDLMMERLDSGFAVARELRSNHHTVSSKILMVTGITQKVGFDLTPENQKELEDLKVDAYLNKPISPAELVRKVRELAEAGQAKAHSCCGRT
ncbi:MAG: response regulator transcription factor [Armatimonadota bacterium]